ncbi:LamG-like jellyroll fold domain-containing protein [Naasia sp. SYSU D00948]|uniref:LamG-like jellyroll fold domain-containing protein n=1 Tax=Naasia sp. SYSU D00948 TaxID=2817379 RepID=UPI001B31730A|nr:LamG-like jellyroll fold domain-containing protein [Naasia sp. SYSU D00948]
MNPIAAMRALRARRPARVVAAGRKARVPLRASAAAAGVLTLALSTAGGTTALWTGSVDTTKPPSITSGFLDVTLTGFTGLTHTYSSDALDTTSWVRVANAGDVSARYTASVTLSPTSSAPLASATQVTRWVVASSNDCTPTSAPSSATTSTWSSVPVLNGTVAAGGSATWCFRTRIPSTSLITTAAVAPTFTLTSTGLNGGWARTVTASATQNVIADRASGNDYTDAVRADGADHYWRLGETSGAILYDWVGTADAYAGSGLARGQAGALVDDPNKATDFSGDAAGTAGTRVAETPDNTLAVEAWIKTTTTTGGKIVGFGSSSTGSSSTTGRHLYMDTTGRVHFGVNSGGQRVVSSPAALNDGSWHHLVGQLGPSGLELFVDGTRVASNAGVTTAQIYSGYWRIGSDTSWAGDSWFDGTVDDVATYANPLHRDAVKNHWNLSGRGAYPVGVGDPYGAAVYDDSPTLFWRLGESGETTAVDSGRGGHNGTYSGGVTKGASGAVPSTRNTAASFNGADGLVSSAQATAAPTVYSVELWFKTTSTRGGKLIGFGDSATGSSVKYDRHLYLSNDGRINFGVWSDGAHTATSTQSYNNGQWHHAVATQGSDGIAVYVDGQLVATNPVTSAEAGTGFWRVGGDDIGFWPNYPSSGYVAAAIDEVAVYSTALTPVQIKRHWSIVSTAPAAYFTTTINGLQTAHDASASSDYRGTITSYSWNWGNGDKSSGVAPTHVYKATGTYTIVLTVTDNSGRTDTWTRVVSVRDITPPSTPGTPSVDVNDGSSIALSWAASSDDVGVVAYDVYRDNVLIGSSGNRFYTDMSFTLGSTYVYRVVARDATGNVSASSAETTVVVPPVAANTWYRISTADGSRCAAVSSGLKLLTCGTSSMQNETFRFQATSDGYYRIIVRTAGEWSVAGSSLLDGALVELRDWSGGGNQQWKPVPLRDGTYTFTARHSGMCLDSRAASGVDLQQWTCLPGEPGQLFRLAKS